MKKDIVLNGLVVGEFDATGDNEVDMLRVREYLKVKGLYKEVSKNGEMYGQANSFAEVANNIYLQDLKKSPYKGSCASPFVVNAVFSIELYLKTILNAYGIQVRGHNLKDLYDRIPQDGMKVFVKASEEIFQLYEHEEGKSIHDYLYDLSNAFSQWRYLYELNKITTELQSIRYTMHAVG